MQQALYPSEHLVQHFTPLWTTAAVLAISLYTDLRWRKIPNVVVLPYLLLGFIYTGIAGGWAGLGQSSLGLLVGGTFLGLLAYLGGMGMGDVKLCAAIGVWVGPHQMLIALVGTGIAGGVLALLWAAFGGFTSELFGNTADLLGNFCRTGLRPNRDYVLDTPGARKMPYAPAIVIGTALSFLAS